MKVLLICGSTRHRSTNSAVLAALGGSAPPGSQAALLDGMAELPAFNPDLDGDPLPTRVVALREAIAGSDAVVFSTPEYAGTLPGSLKNLLDWCVGAMVLSGKPTGIVNAAAPGRGLGALATLRTVLAYVGASVVEVACVDVPVGRGPGGAPVITPAAAAALATVWDALSGG